jgi:hypothetical protein
MPRARVQRERRQLRGGARREGAALAGTRTAYIGAECARGYRIAGEVGLRAGVIIAERGP